MQHTVAWVSIGIQFHTTAHIRTIGDTGNKHFSFHHGLMVISLRLPLMVCPCMVSSPLLYMVSL